MTGEAARLGRRFLADLALTIGAAVVLGIVVYLFIQATKAGHPLDGYDGYRSYVEAAAGVVVGLLFMRAVGRLISGYLRSQGDQRHETMVRLFFNILVAVVVLFYVASVAGVDLQNLFLGSALAGVVLGLASQTLLGNVFAGVTIALWGPFRTGDRISVVSANYGALAPSYPHETLYPAYTGTVVDIGLQFTVLRLDSGRLAKLPNSIIQQALIVNITQSPVRAIRVRLTLPHTVPVPAAECAVAALTSVPGLVAPGRPAPLLQVADVGSLTWDGLVTVWSADPDEDRLKDLVLRAVYGRTGLAQPPAAAAKP